MTVGGMGFIPERLLMMMMMILIIPYSSSIINLIIEHKMEGKEQYLTALLTASPSTNVRYGSSPTISTVSNNISEALSPPHLMPRQPPARSKRPGWPLWE